MKIKNKIALMAAALSVIGFAVPISSSGNPHEAARPFHAVIHGNANPFPIDPCTLGNHETGSGHALHLGAITWTSDETVKFLSCSPPSPPGSAIAVSGTFTITAANGDEIKGEYQTTGTLDPVNGVSVLGAYTLVSGTGRFANVTGSGVIAAHGAGAPPFEFVSSMNGIIEYDRHRNE